MSVNSFYPCTTNDVCVTSIIKNKIREYMMNDSLPFKKSSVHVSISDVKNENKNCMMSECEKGDVNKQCIQEVVSTTDLLLPSSLDVHMHNSYEPCPHTQQDLVTASARRIGNSLDVLLHQSKKESSQFRAIKKLPSVSISVTLDGSAAVCNAAATTNVASVNQCHNTNGLFVSSDQIRYKKTASLHDICEDYIQFITINSAASTDLDEHIVTTTSKNEFESKTSRPSSPFSFSLLSPPPPPPPPSLQPEHKQKKAVIPVCFPLNKPITQISVITINENLSRNSTTVIKQR